MIGVKCAEYETGMETPPDANHGVSGISPGRKKLWEEKQRKNPLSVAVIIPYPSPVHQPTPQNSRI
jgi:hypothetical protein